MKFRCLTQPEQHLSVANAVALLLELFRKNGSLFWDRHVMHLSVTQPGDQCTVFVPPPMSRLSYLFEPLAKLVEAIDVPTIDRSIRQILGPNATSIHSRAEWMPSSYRNFVDANDVAWLTALLAGKYLTRSEVRKYGAIVVQEATLSQLRRDYEEGDHWSFEEALEQLTSC